MGHDKLGFWEEGELEKVLSCKNFPPRSGTSVIRPIEPWEVPLNGRPCVVTYRYGEQSKAVFRAFSTDYEELNDGVGLYPVAIVELEDGTLEAVYVEQVRFTDRGEKDG